MFTFIVRVSPLLVELTSGSTERMVFPCSICEKQNKGNSIRIIKICSLNFMTLSCHKVKNIYSMGIVIYKVQIQEY
ncbi:hypothetical protein SDC9_129007 [bioreactor metagenome]|uniref:Uncharacterized protein n=1 Tax=bioreactor metagenome TaxID=1076179 RepID=A0A645CYF5_9ZZZZ